MNEQLQGKLVEILSGIQAAAKATGDFAMEQLPDIAQSYVLYGRVTTTAGLVVMLCVAAACAYVALFKGFFDHKAVHKSGYAEGSWLDSRFISAFVGSVAFCMIALPLTFAFASSAALVWFAPKVWLLKELAGLIK